MLVCSRVLAAVLLVSAASAAGIRSKYIPQFQEETTSDLPRFQEASVELVAAAKCASVKVSIKAVDFLEDIQWNLEKGGTTVPGGEAGPFPDGKSGVYSKTLSLGPGSYTLVLEDIYADGWGDKGCFSVEVGGKTVASCVSVPKEGSRYAFEVAGGQATGSCAAAPATDFAPAAAAAAGPVAASGGGSSSGGAKAKITLVGTGPTGATGGATGATGATGGATGATGATGMADCKPGAKPGKGCKKDKSLEGLEGLNAAVDAACPKCKPGEYSEVPCTKCSKCAAGKFQDVREQTACKDAKCAPGSSIAAAGATNGTCAPCAPGSAGGGGTKQCAPCARGSFAAAAGALACAKCPPGKTTAKKGGANCTACAEGTYLRDVECVPKVKLTCPKILGYPPQVELVTEEEAAAEDFNRTLCAKLCRGPLFAGECALGESDPTDPKKKPLVARYDPGPRVISATCFTQGSGDSAGVPIEIKVPVAEYKRDKGRRACGRECCGPTFVGSCRVGAKEFGEANATDVSYNPDCSVKKVDLKCQDNQGNLVYKDVTEAEYKTFTKPAKLCVKYCSGPSFVRKVPGDKGYCFVGPKDAFRYVPLAD
eukprot:g2969.t1